MTGVNIIRTFSDGEMWKPLLYLIEQWIWNSGWTRSNRLSRLRRSFWKICQKYWSAFQGKWPTANLQRCLQTKSLQIQRGRFHPRRRSSPKTPIHHLLSLQFLQRKLRKVEHTHLWIPSTNGGPDTHSNPCCGSNQRFPLLLKLCSWHYSMSKIWKRFLQHILMNKQDKLL